MQIQIPPDRLRRSQHVGVPLRVLYSYCMYLSSCHSSCKSNPQHILSGNNLQSPQQYCVRGMVKHLPVLQRVGNNGHPWDRAIMCDNTNSDICMIIHGDSCFNLVKSASRYSKFVFKLFFIQIWCLYITGPCNRHDKAHGSSSWSENHGGN